MQAERIENIARLVNNRVTGLKRQLKSWLKANSAMEEVSNDLWVACVFLDAWAVSEGLEPTFLDRAFKPWNCE